MQERGKSAHGVGSIGVIGSIGLTPEAFLDDPHEQVVETDSVPVPVARGTVGEHEVVLLQRSHGRSGVAPHVVDYRSSILAFAALGVERVFATSVVGSLTTSIPPLTLVVIDQFLDFTKQRRGTLFGADRFAFVDVTDPYCPQLRGALIEAARTVGEDVRPHGCYVAVEGPRFETRAEIEMYRRLGGDVIGMTNVPEVVMAREAGLCYATVAFVSNLGAGLSGRRVSQAENREVTLAASATLRAVVTRAVAGAPRERACSCGDPPDAIFEADVADDLMMRARAGQPGTRR